MQFDPYRIYRKLPEAWLQGVHADLCPEGRVMVLDKPARADTTILQQGAE